MKPCMHGYQYLMSLKINVMRAYEIANVEQYGVSFIYCFICAGPSRGDRPMVQLFEGQLRTPWR